VGFGRGSEKEIKAARDHRSRAQFLQSFRAINVAAKTRTL
jgi:hypothetical protein